MDKRIIFAVAGSGKTTFLVESIKKEQRYLFLTYTEANYKNLSNKIATKFKGEWPTNVTLMTWFRFLYHFCYKPFLSDIVRAKGLIFEQNKNKRANKGSLPFYLTSNKYFYSNRLSLFLEETSVINEIKGRIEEFFDFLIIDEVQDIAGRDFSFLEKIMTSNVNMLFVGDFFQHTFDTSRDGNVNQSLFMDFRLYGKRFEKVGFILDNTTLKNSWRCGDNVCSFVRDQLGIMLFSNKEKDDCSSIKIITDKDEKEKIIADETIIKLHYKESYKWGIGHRNWGDVKGEDCFGDVCVFLNKNTQSLFEKKQLKNLPDISRNKLYVAITRAHNNVFLVYE